MEQKYNIGLPALKSAYEKSNIPFSARGSLLFVVTRRYQRK